jgi:DNA-directed RNA polymerase subunit RPC12/RpoP
MEIKYECAKCGTIEPKNTLYYTIHSIRDRWHLYFNPDGLKANKTGYVSLCCYCSRKFSEITQKHLDEYIKSP